MDSKNKKIKIFAIVISSLLLVNMCITGVLLGFQINNNIVSNQYKTKYSLYIGTNDKDTYTQVIPFDTCLTKVTEICTKYTGGCTIYEANGYWKDDKGEITKEQTIVAILEDITLETVHKVCDDVIVALNQNSILIETSYVGTTFYSTSSK